MMKKSLLVTGIAMTLLLGGCANNKASEKSVKNLSSRVDQLSSEIRGIKSEHGRLSSETQRANFEAARAHDRIDNIISSYQK